VDEWARLNEEYYGLSGYDRFSLILPPLERDYILPRFGSVRFAELLEKHGRKSQLVY
jgi:hypothetical protein